MDKVEIFTALVSSAEFAMCILGRANTGDYALVDIGPDAGEAQLALITRGYAFVGVLAMVAGATRCALASRIPLEAVPQLGDAFSAHFEDATKAGVVAELTSTAPVDDSEEWCFRLFNLQDPRG